MHSGSLHPNHGFNTIEFKVVNGLLDPQLRMIPLEPRKIKLGKLAGMAAPRTPLIARLIITSWVWLRWTWW